MSVFLSVTSEGGGIRQRHQHHLFPGSESSVHDFLSLLIALVSVAASSVHLDHPRTPESQARDAGLGIREERGQSYRLCQ